MRQTINAISLTLAIYGFAAWVYVAAVSLVAPETLSWRLTHLASWPRTDTFGEISFLVSFAACLTYLFTRRSREAN